MKPRRPEQFYSQWRATRTWRGRRNIDCLPFLLPSSFSRVRLLQRGVNPLQKEKAAHAVDDIGQSDPHGSPHDTYGSGERACL